jgi:hypothetical protein
MSRLFRRKFLRQGLRLQTDENVVLTIPNIYLNPPITAAVAEDFLWEWIGTHGEYDRLA